MLNFMKNGSEAKFKGAKRLAGLLLLLGVLGGCGLWAKAAEHPPGSGGGQPGPGAGNTAGPG